LEISLKKILSPYILILAVFILLSCNETDKIVDDEEKNDTDNYIQDIDSQDEDPDPCDDGRKWHEPVTLTDNKIDGVFPKLIKLDDGVMLIYQQHTGSTSDGDYHANLYSQTYNSSNGWQEPVLIDSFNAEKGTPIIEKVTDLKGDSLFFLVNAQNWTTATFSLLVYEYSINNGWKTAVELDSYNAVEQYYTFFNINKNDSGDAVLTWSYFSGEEENRKWAAFAKIYTQSDGWSEPHTLVELGIYDSALGSTVLNSDGDAIVKVLTKKDDVYNQEIVRYLKNGGWQEPEEIPFERFIGWMKIYNDNDIFVTLYNPDGDSNELWSGRYTKDDGWVEDETMLRKNIDNIEDFDGFDLSINSKGDVVSAWNHVYPTEHYSDGELWINTYALENGWKGEEKIETETIKRQIDTTISENGDLFISWTEVRLITGLFDMEHYIWAKRYKPHVGWCPSKIVSEQINSDYSQIIVDDDGNAVMIWESRENDISIIRAAEFY